jgi:hypothetical protein
MRYSLREHQNRFIQFAETNGFIGALAQHGMGCIQGDMLIPVSRGGNTRRVRIQDLYYSFKGIKLNRRRGYDHSIPTYTRSIKDGVMGLNRIVDVYESGVKDIIELRVEGKISIQCTHAHRIWTKRGWVHAGHLVPDRDYIACDLTTKHQSKKAKSRSKKSKPKYNVIQMGEFHRFAHYVKSRKCYRVEIHRAIYDAAQNGMTLEEFQKATHYNPNLKLTNPREYHIHHIDHDHRNHELSNLERLSVEDHYKHHGDAGNLGHGLIAWKKLLSVVPAGSAMTYDMTCESPYNSFVANKIVVHNSGKTLSAMDFLVRSFSKLRQSGVANPKAMVIIPKSAHTTWQSECHKFTPELYRSLLLIPYSQMHKAVNLCFYHDIRAIILDESHFVKNPETERSENLAAIFNAVHKSPGQFKGGKVLLLSGTPMTNGAQEYYTSWAICASSSLAESAERIVDVKRFEKWKVSFAQRKEREWDTRYSGKKKGATHEGIQNADMLAKLLNPIVDVVRTEDCVDLPEKIEVPIDLNLDDDKLLADADIDHPENYMELLEKLSRAKTPHMISWIRDYFSTSNEPLVIFSMYKFPLIEAKSTFHGKIELITGEQSNDERADIIRRFQSGKIRALGLTYGAGAESLNLQNAKTSLYHGYPWTYAKVAQAMARTYRGGQLHKTMHYFLTSGYYDQQILGKVLRKKEDSELINDLLLTSTQERSGAVALDTFF